MSSEFLTFLKLLAACLIISSLWATNNILCESFESKAARYVFPIPVAATINALSNPSSLVLFKAYKASICAPLGSNKSITLFSLLLFFLYSSSLFSISLKTLGLTHDLEYLSKTSSSTIIEWL